MTPLDQASMTTTNIDALRNIKVTNDEVQQLAVARQSGLSDDSCLELVRISHSRNQPFTGGQDIAGLLGAGFAENSILTLARLKQLGLWSGEAEAMRLANLPDAVILVAAKRRAAGQSVLSGAKVAALHNDGLSDKEIIDIVDRGTTDAEADDIIYRRNYLAGGHSFVHQQGRRR